MFILVFVVAVVVEPRGMWGLCSLTKDQTHAPRKVEGQNLNHWTTREIPVCASFKITIKNLTFQVEENVLIYDINIFI